MKICECDTALVNIHRKIIFKSHAKVISIKFQILNYLVMDSLDAAARETASD